MARDIATAVDVALVWLAASVINDELVTVATAVNVTVLAEVGELIVDEAALAVKESVA